MWLQLVCAIILILLIIITITIITNYNDHVVTFIWMFFLTFLLVFVYVFCFVLFFVCKTIEFEFLFKAKGGNLFTINPMVNYNTATVFEMIFFFLTLDV